MNTAQSEPVEILNYQNQPKILPYFLRQSTTMSTKDYFDDITIYTQFGDLSPSQLLTLFHQFKNWPGYKNSSFVTCVENNLLKMETSGVTNVDGIEINEEADDDDNDNDSNSKNENVSPIE